MAPTAELFADEEIPTAVHVEYFDKEGGCEVAISMGREGVPRNAERRAASLI
jgi:hypothetical protein